VVYLNAPASSLLLELGRVDGNPYVIVGRRKSAPLVGIDKIWFSVRKRAQLHDVRLHDLRHSFASVGAIGGLSLPIIGALLFAFGMLTLHKKTPGKEFDFLESNLASTG
jgi:hypothetical protein